MSREPVLELICLYSKLNDLACLLGAGGGGSRVAQVESQLSRVPCTKQGPQRVGPFAAARSFSGLSLLEGELGVMVKTDTM